MRKFHWKIPDIKQGYPTHWFKEMLHIFLDDILLSGVTMLGFVGITVNYKVNGSCHLNRYIRLITLPKSAMSLILQFARIYDVTWSMNTVQMIINAYVNIYSNKM